MTRVENHCCDCAAPGYPCRGSYCPLTKVEVFYCDSCGEPIDPEDVVRVDGEDLCLECYEKEIDDGQINT